LNLTNFQKLFHKKIIENISKYFLYHIAAKSEETGKCPFQGVSGTGSENDRRPRRLSFQAAKGLNRQASMQERRKEEKIRKEKIKEEIKEERKRQ
jgi:hypothetical protein